MGSVQSAGHRLRDTNKVHAHDMSAAEALNGQSFRKRSASLQDKVNLDESQQQHFMSKITLERRVTNLQDQSLTNGLDITPHSHLMDMEVSSTNFIPFSERCQNSDVKSSETVEKKQTEYSARFAKKLSLNLTGKGAKFRGVVSPQRHNVCSIIEDPPVEEAHSEPDQHPHTIEYTNDEERRISETSEEHTEQLTRSQELIEKEALLAQMKDLEGLTDEGELTKTIKRVLFGKSKKFGVFVYENNGVLDDVEAQFLPPYQYPETKEIYYGTWKDGKRHGRGCLIWPDESVYQGSWYNDLRSGKGRYINAKGNMYEGEWKDGKLHGKGKCTYASGTVYDGEWLEDRRHGYGCEVYADRKTTYQGNFENNVKKGRGSQRWADGSTYTGDFAENIMNGFGTLEWADGRKYKGEWQNDKMHGKGEFYWPDGRKFVGQYRNDMKDGYGEFEWPDKKKYKGPFVANKMHGQGFYLSSDGKEREGVWQEGKVLRWMKE